MFYTYVIRSRKDKKWYTGCTGDLRKRFNEHNNNNVLSTKAEDHLKYCIMSPAIIDRMPMLEKNI